MTLTERQTGAIASAPARFLSRITITEEGCWRWLGAVNPEGYAVFSWLREDGTKVKSGRAHIFSYQLWSGDTIPEGWHLDHTCHTYSACPGGRSCLHRRCVAWEHLEPVSATENHRRAQANLTATMRRTAHARTHCRAGHELTPENTIWRTQGNRRECRACLRRTKREYAERERRKLGRPVMPTRSHRAAS